MYGIAAVRRKSFLFIGRMSKQCDDANAKGGLISVFLVEKENLISHGRRYSSELASQAAGQAGKKE